MGEDISVTRLEWLHTNSWIQKMIAYVVWDYLCGQTFAFQGLPRSSRDAACCCQRENHSIEQRGPRSAGKQKHQKYAFYRLSNTEVLATGML